ncbi:MAG: hypothetical protein ACK4SZ_08265 [Allosphingosinicella sp.]|uniref:hypothetical protein n=1 Tax=Allosphingosinicella sp. TaxID=2823234 RepID=UPI00395E5E5E
MNDVGGADNVGDGGFDASSEQSRASRWRAWFERRAPQINRRLDGAERSFLGLLRAVALVTAGLLIVASIVLLALGFGLQIQDPDSVQVNPVEVTPVDVVPPPAPQAAPANRQAAQQPHWARVLSPEFRRQYYQLYRSAFAPSYRPNERPLEQQAFFEQMFPDEVLDEIEMVDDSRLQLSQGGEEAGRQGGNERLLLVSLRSAVEGAAGQEGVRRELKAYKDAQRIQVCRNEERTRSRAVEYWDYSARNCPYWYEPPYGCMSRRQVSEPYEERVCRMQFPEDLANPMQVMRGLQNRYFAALDGKIAGSLREAELQRQRILERNQSGKDWVWKAVLAFVAFLGLMFLYLLVALERHHRAISRRLASSDE